MMKYRHHHQRQLRQHGEHGAGHAVPAVPAAAAKQILLNNFLSDLPSIAISTDRVDPERLNVLQRWQVKDLQRFMIVFG